MLILSYATSSTCLTIAADKSVNESCFLALQFVDGNVASIQLSNTENKQRDVNIERYSSDGRLLENVTKTLPANGNTEVRLDLSSTTPEFGWVRVLTSGKAFAISMTLERMQQETFESLPEQAVYRHPEPNKHLSTLPHKWKFDLINSLSSLAYFVNLSKYPVQVAMCQDDVPDCTNPTLPYTVAPMGSISFPLDHSRRYAVIESTPGYSAATSVRFTEGSKKYFEASSCIKFEGSTSCAPTPLQSRTIAAKYVSPIGQKVTENSQAAINSPAAQRRQPGDPSTPEELEDWIKNGKASRCAIASVPPGAEIYLDGFTVGVAPIVFVLLKRDAPRIIEIRMAGYRLIEKRVIPDGQPIILGVDLEKQ
jgi:hypothetical protein